MNLSNNKGDIRSAILSYIKYWKWFVLCGIVALMIAHIKIRYTIPEYQVQAQIQIVQDKNSTNEMSAFQDLNILGSTSKQVEDEIELLASRSNFIEVVKELGINVQVTALGKVINSEVYKSVPFNFNFIASDSIIQNSNYNFVFEFLTDTTFGFAEAEDVPVKIHSFGNGVPTKIGDIIITPKSKSPKSLQGKRYKIQVRPVVAVANSIKNGVNIAMTGEMSNILNLTMTGSIPEKSVDILNKLIEVYNKNAIEEKKRIADTTSDFINNRIQLISGTLSDVDKDAQEMLTEKGMTGSGLEVGAAVQVSATSRQNLESARVQLNMVSGMREYVNEEDGYEQMPVVDLGSSAISQATTQYNQLVAERNRLLKSADERNPMIVNLDQQS